MSKNCEHDLYNPSKFILYKILKDFCTLLCKIIQYFEKIFYLYCENIFVYFSK